MRTLISFTHVSLDGYFAGKNGDIDWAYQGSDDAQWNRFVSNNAKGGGVLVFGRKTYEMMASFWPTPMAARQFPTVAKQMNALPKLVFSKKLKKATWDNTEVVNGDMVAAMKKIKKTPGDNMVILGSGSLVSQLARAGLIDELQLVVSPTVLGEGKKLFEDGELALTLIKTRAFRNGKVLLRYAPA